MRGDTARRQGRRLLLTAAVVLTIIAVLSRCGSNDVERAAPERLGSGGTYFVVGTDSSLSMSSEPPAQWFNVVGYDLRRQERIGGCWGDRRASAPVPRREGSVTYTAFAAPPGFYMPEGWNTGSAFHADRGRTVFIGTFSARWGSGGRYFAPLELVVSRTPSDLAAASRAVGSALVLSRSQETNGRAMGYLCTP